MPSSLFFQFCAAFSPLCLCLTACKFLASTSLVFTASARWNLGQVLCLREVTEGYCIHYAGLLEVISRSSNTARSPCAPRNSRSLLFTWKLYIFRTRRLDITIESGGLASRLFPECALRRLQSIPDLHNQIFSQHVGIKPDYDLAPARPTACTQSHACKCSFAYLCRKSHT